jgi:small subunit ribosomal protein S1
VTDSDSDNPARHAATLPHTYHVTKYDPADRGENGAYTGSEDSMSDHGPVEAAYLAAFTAFSEDAGVDHVLLREPAVGTLVNFGLEPNIDGHGLRGLFPEDLSGYHDGASVSLDTARELLRAMLRDHGAWSRLEVEGRFTAHVGYDQYLYLASSTPPDRALALIEASGLFAVRIDWSPYRWQSDDPPARAADGAFWDEVAALVEARGPLLLEERHLQNASRWHRLTPERTDRVRAGLTARSRLLLWPDLSTDLQAVRKDLRRALRDGLAKLVTEDEQGVLADQYLFRRRAARAALRGVRAARVMSVVGEVDRPLMTAVLPDADGVLRARWTP